MKKIVFSLVLLLFIIFNLSAQIIYYRTQNYNIGFGKVSDCKTNPYLDFCVNGPLVGEDGLPLGGYIDNTTLAKDWTNPLENGGNFAIDNVIFGLGIDGNFYMISYNQKNNLPKMKWAFQNGPILVKDGVNVRGTSKTKYERSGIGFKKDGTITVIVSLSPLTFYQFADLFVKEDCTNAVYLDGGPYAGCSDKNTCHGTMVNEAIKLQFFNN